MRISHEAIYQALYVQSRGALKQGVGHLPAPGPGVAGAAGLDSAEGVGACHPRDLDQPAAGWGRRSRCTGPLGGDLLIGLQRSAIRTLVERHSRFPMMLVHLPRGGGLWGDPANEEQPALAGYGAITMASALMTTITTLPTELRRSLTWDRGKEIVARPVLHRYRSKGVLR